MPDEPIDTIRLAAGDAAAEVALRGAEPLSWRVGGRELLWHGDPEHWAFRAPILFPVVGASAGGEVRVGGVAYPMPQHGFARRLPFEVVEQATDSVRLRLTDGAETRPHYPFAFRLDVVATLAADSLTLAFEVTGGDTSPMPYGLGFHPAFPWPLDGTGRTGRTGREGHRVVFEQEEGGDVPEIAAGGLLARRTRRVPLDGTILPLAPELFTEALVFLDARSRSFAFEAPSGSAIAMDMEAFPHLAVWSRATAPFLSLEAWTAHADREGAEGELADRPSMIVLAPGETRRHTVRMSWRAP